ncbi:hypothetical protein BU23DRAFT_554808 [Bimuria novae-zelandiae CBS 107.79]|uniref:Uncharacterized protein n=1 Tax=Bimuria novae-zelandiae CBS 107.79 TaxID=1447943 RepID=A0A6A5V8I1_9PLEO|nr:hypothetical protein BU23DRAFT_554808 [Bimuria novae-zelandiae CBS 107.79]
MNFLTVVIFAVLSVSSAAAPTTHKGFAGLATPWRSYRAPLADGATCEESWIFGIRIEWYEIYEGHHCDFYLDDECKQLTRSIRSGRDEPVGTFPEGQMPHKVHCYQV